jgi:hypothetical protein
MPLPAAMEALWSELQSVRALVLKEVEGLSQAQADWRPSEREWSVGEVIHHLTLAETATGKLTSKLLKEAPQPLPAYPRDLKGFAPLPERIWPMEAPPMVRPERGHPLAELLAGIKAARERSRQSVERLAQVDPRAFTWNHFALGSLDLAQWWMLTAAHDADHLQQIRAVKATRGFPRA